MNQHYCHLSALALAHLANASLIWPPMQERAPFDQRFHSDAHENDPRWRHLDANTLWDLPSIQQSFKGARRVPQRLQV